MDSMNNVTPPTDNGTPNGNPGTGAKFCPRCGKVLPENSLFCGECGFNLSGNANFSAPPAKPPQDTSPLKTSDFLIMLLLLCIPLVGLIVMLVWAFSGNTNINRQNFSRAWLIYYAIALVLSIIMVVGMIAILGMTAATFSEYAYAYPALIGFIFH